MTFIALWTTNSGRFDTHSLYFWPGVLLKPHFRNDTQRNALLPHIDEEEIPMQSSNRAETAWKDSQDSFDQTDDEELQEQATPTEAIKLCKYASGPAQAPSESQNGGSRPISSSLHSISSTRPSLKPPAPPVPDPSALLNAPPDFPPPPPPPALESSGNLIANPKYPYHVPIANQSQDHLVQNDAD